VCVSSVLTKIIKTGYATLQLEYFFTAGPDEVRAWTVRVSPDARPTLPFLGRRSRHKLLSQVLYLAIVVKRWYFFLVVDLDM